MLGFRLNTSKNAISLVHRRIAHKAFQRGYCTPKEEKQVVKAPKGRLVPKKLPTQVSLRKPTVDEEIAHIKKRDWFRMFFVVTGVIIGKLCYDIFCNQLQLNSYDAPDDELVARVWEVLGDDAWEEAKRARVIKQRFGRPLEINKDSITISKKKQKRFWETHEWIEKAAFIFLRYRFRVYEDIGTVYLRAPIEGRKLKGDLYVKAYTRDSHWILAKAWVEDDDMIIEIKKRLKLGFIINPDDEFLEEAERVKNERW